jgi:hypothetical protein
LFTDAKRRKEISLTDPYIDTIICNQHDFLYYDNTALRVSEDQLYYLQQQEDELLYTEFLREKEIVRHRLFRYYYFDIETVPYEHFLGYHNASFEPIMSKIICIQYQQLDARTGQPLGELEILREWSGGSSEKTIVEKFKRIFLDDGVWAFIPVGNNLIHEFRFLKYKLRYYLNLDRLQLGQRPMIDLKSILIIKNHGYFKGCASAIGKCGKAANMAAWYMNKDYDLIDQYVIEEAEDFVHAYSILKNEIPKVNLGRP